MTLPPRLKPRKVPSQERSRALVDAVLQAAARVLVEKGYEAMLMSEVAEIAGVSVGSLYQYFPNKESLVAQLVEKSSEEEVAFISERLTTLDGSTLEDLLLAAVRATLRFRASRPALQRAMLDVIPHIGRHPALAERGARLATQLELLLAPRYEAFREASAEPLPPIDHAVFVLANATHALTHEGLLRQPADLSDDALAAQITRLVLGYLYGPRRSPA